MDVVVVVVYTLTSTTDDDVDTTTTLQYAHQRGKVALRMKMRVTNIFSANRWRQRTSSQTARDEHLLAVPIGNDTISNKAPVSSKAAAGTAASDVNVMPPRLAGLMPCKSISWV